MIADTVPLLKADQPMAISKALVAAVYVPTGAIGFQNRLPWPRLAGDFRFLKWATTSVWSVHADDRGVLTARSEPSSSPSKTAAAAGGENIVVMGRKTWESIGQRPLPGRRNIVVSRTLSSSPTVVASLQDLQHSGASETPSPATYVLGGSQLYAEALSAAFCQCAFLTLIYPLDDKQAPLPHSTVFPHLEDVLKTPFLDITDHVCRELALPAKQIGGAAYVVEGFLKYQFRIYFLNP